MPHISRALSFGISVAATFDLHNLIVANATTFGEAVIGDRPPQRSRELI
jgi:hypothetical protein